MQLGRIEIAGLRLFGYIGVNEQEKVKGQIYVVELTASVDMEKAQKSDNIEDTVSYSGIIKLLKELFEKSRYNLLETMARVIIDEVFSSFNEVLGVTVKIKKPNAPIGADFSYVAVELFAERQK